jgi:hypothetical protein
LIIKNLPFSLDGDEPKSLFTDIGTVLCWVLPPSHTLALVEFGNNQDPICRCISDRATVTANDRSLWNGRQQIQFAINHLKRDYLFTLFEVRGQCRKGFENVSSLERDSEL